MAGDETVRDYVTLVRGITYKGELVGKPGPALLGLGSIQPGGGFREGDYKTYGGDCPPKLMLTPGDLFVSLKGATKDGKMIGSVARVPASVPSGRLTQDTVKLEFRSDERAKASSYLYWMLRTPQYRAYCEGRAMGSAVVALSRDDFLDFSVPIVSGTRQGIVEVLEQIEDKIELNRRMNATLEEMARALFQSWFVDFDPVRAKLDGRQPVGIDPLTAAFFPKDLDETALGHTPKGWEVKSLDNIADYLNGLALQKYPPGDGPTLPVIKIAQLRKGDSVGADRCNAGLPPSYIVQDGDVLFSWSGSLEVKLWCGGPGALNQHLFKVTSREFPKWFYFLWSCYHLNEFRLIAADKATTMGHIQRGHLTAAKVLIPPRPLLEAMTCTMSPLIDQLIANSIQSRSLAILRDMLLPKLLSGEMSLAEMNKEVFA
jgi:type I restriction enzyme S subunit